MPQPELRRTGPNPAMLRWAREDAGLSLDEAARRLRLRRSNLVTPGNRLAQYETGAQPVPSELVHLMCGVYRQPIINFFASEPPLPDDYGHDFRTFHEPTTPEEEGALRAIQGDLFVRQSVVRDSLEESEDHSPLQLVGDLDRDDGIASAVNRLHSLFDTARHEDPCDRVRSPRELFRELRSRIERLGVFVLIANDAKDRYLKLRCSAFSGITISDKLAPFVVVNGDDPALSPAFELVHQFVHLLVGTTGVCNAPPTIGRITGACETETFCCEVAEEFLVPSELVTRTIGDPAPGTVTAPQLAEWIRAMANKRHVSYTTVGNQLRRHKRVRGTDLVQQAESLTRKRNGTSREASGTSMTTWPSNTRSAVGQKGELHLEDQRERLGQPLIHLVRALVGEGAITYNSAALALGTTAGMAASLLHDH